MDNPFEVTYDFEGPEQFWDELEEVLSAECITHQAIDDILRTYLKITTEHKSQYLTDDHDISRACNLLLASNVFNTHSQYVRRQCVYALLQEEESPALHILASILLRDGNQDEAAYVMLSEEGGFPRIVELVSDLGSDDEQADLHRCLLEIMYEMSRIQRLSWEDLQVVQDSFVLSLFQVTELLSSDASDPYHYPIIRVLLVLNEQYMVLSATATSDHPPLTNRVLKALSMHLSSYKTFGENLILLLNRESETSLQLLILKLLYLVFNTSSTSEYFYTNDLHVLTDVILRNLLDLPAENEAMKALRHTYLRVLHPLLANSQLSREGMAYKPREILGVLRVLEGRDSFHFAPSDATTIRLVQRCRTVPWLKEIYDQMLNAGQISPEPNDDGRESPAHKRVDSARREGEGVKQLARRTLGMNLNDAGESALSVAAVAEHTAKPGESTPSKGLVGIGNVAVEAV